MAQETLGARLEDIEEQLLQEFASTLPRDTVVECLRETVAVYESARVSDFVPLFVHRETRERLVALSRKHIAN